MSNTINNVNEIQVINNHGELVVSSHKVAEDFGKQHKNVLATIREILAAENSATKFFHITTHEYRGQQFPETLEVAPDDNRLYTVTDIGKEFGLPARALNKLLIAWKIQECAGAHYELCEGLDDSKFVHYTFFRGQKASMKWTGSGRLLIHKRLKEHGYNLVK